MLPVNTVRLDLVDVASWDTAFRANLVPAMRTDGVKHHLHHLHISIPSTTSALEDTFRPQFTL
jgi:hypothetical protein